LVGGFLALLAAATFAMNNAAFRRGALTGSVWQAMAISLPLGVVMFFAAALATGSIGLVAAFPTQSVVLLAVAGILHFAWGRYCNFRATKAMGGNLVGPVQQVSLIITLGLAVGVLGEAVTPLRLLGIVLVVLGPAIMLGGARPAAGADAEAPVFRPNYAEGYTFALLSASGYGASPVLVRMSLEGGGIGGSLAGGLIAYLAALAVLAPALILPARLRELSEMDRGSAKWFTASGVLVSLSQMFGYAALALAPVSVVTPIQRLSLVFRVFAGSLLNRDYEVLGARVWVATIIGLAGALALSISTEFVLQYLPLPDWLQTLVRWRWP
jgi:uncharacterized membrane protein